MTMYLTDSPQALPGCCRMCGSATKTPMIDLGYIEDFHGAVYYCIECAGTIATMFGFTSPVDTERMGAEIKRLTSRLDTLIMQNKELEHVNEAIERAGYHKLPSTANTGTPDLFTSGLDFTPVPEESPFKFESDESVESTAIEPASRTTKSSNVPQLDRIRTGSASGGPKRATPAIL